MAHRPADASFVLAALESPGGQIPKDHAVTCPHGLLPRGVLLPTAARTAAHSSRRWYTAPTADRQMSALAAPRPAKANPPFGSAREEPIGTVRPCLLGSSTSAIDSGWTRALPLSPSARCRSPTPSRAVLTAWTPIGTAGARSFPSDGPWRERLCREELAGQGDRPRARMRLTEVHGNAPMCTP